MNGNPTYHAIALAVGTLLVLPIPVGVLAGWTPRRFRGRWSAARLHARAVLCLYTLMPINAVPRMLDASADTVTACTLLGFVSLAASAVFFIRAERAVGRTPTRVS
ncbi:MULTISPECIES: hypothetical protein [unclassified Streptomyces]|uniref:hypothetical protein n=1 Tax=unclassified Streptomyces TaxID=2593676 RepID=UPI002E36503A|nr:MULTISPECIES: hypothetical protein [unclassified Streptomyces]WUC62796.1 hypothetical protein OG861_00380 [Streptomyces sp. NBC_00539]